MQFYEKNLQALITKNPQLEAKLYAISTNLRYEVFADPNDALNVNIVDNVHKYVLHQGKPVDEVTKQYEELFEKYGRYPLLFVYGVDNGLLVKMFLNLDKTIYLFEPELELLYIALNLFDFSEAIENERLKIFHTKSFLFNDLYQTLMDPNYKVFLKTFELIVTNEYYFQFFSEDILRVNRDVVEQIKHIITAEGNDAIDSLIGLDHHLKHIPKMLRSYKLHDVAKAKNSKTAVIVSTGPSLAKQLPLLKEYAPYITILCIDASLPILQKEGIAPDFVFSLERVEATAKFYEELDKDLLQDTIFMPTSIVHPKLLENIEGMRQAISMRPFGYTHMFQLSKWGYMGIGMSAANMAFEFAFMSGYENIVLIGQDLAFGDDGTTHAKGALYGEVEEGYKKSVEYVPGYYGGEVKTSRVWKLFLNFFKKDIQVAKEKGLRVYNCTEGGAYIDGAEHIPFQEYLITVDRTKRKNRIDLQVESEQKIEYLLKRSKKLIKLYVKRLECVKKRVEDVFLEVMKTIEYLEELNAKEHLDKLDTQKLSDVISKIDEIKDLYENDRALRKFGNITNPYIVNAELELAKIMVRQSDKDIEKQVKMIDWIYEHKSWLFFLAGAIDNILETMQKHYSQIYIKF